MKHHCKSCGGTVVVEQKCDAVFIWKKSDETWLPTSEVMVTKTYAELTARCVDCEKYDAYCGWLALRTENGVVLRYIFPKNEDVNDESPLTTNSDSVVQ